MSHAVLRIMLHAVGPLGGFVRPGHCTRFELTESTPLPRNLERLQNGLASSIDWQKFIPYSGSEIVAECKTGTGR